MRHLSSPCVRRPRALVGGDVGSRPGHQHQLRRSIRTPPFFNPGTGAGGSGYGSGSAAAAWRRARRRRAPLPPFVPAADRVCPETFTYPFNGENSVELSRRLQRLGVDDLRADDALGQRWTVTVHVP